MLFSSLIYSGPIFSGPFYGGPVYGGNALQSSVASSPYQQNRTGLETGATTSQQNTNTG